MWPLTRTHSFGTNCATPPSHSDTLCEPGECCLVSHLQGLSHTTLAHLFLSLFLSHFQIEKLLLQLQMVTQVSVFVIKLI